MTEPAAPATSSFVMAAEPRLADYPFLIVAICANPNETWYVAGTCRAKARANFEAARKNWARPLYCVNAKWDADRVRSDYALTAMAPASQRVH